MKKPKQWIWLSGVLIIWLIATVIRFYQLGSSARGFYLDEAAIGYNAYSILKTGKDEFGQSFPVLFRSFTDFKAPLYIYLSTIPIKIFGLDIFSTRFLSAFSGSITVPVVFLLMRLVFPADFLLPSLVALVLATAPWHIFYSRGAWEANLAFLILTLASYFCVLGFKLKRRAVFLLGAILFVLSTYAYHGQRIVAPLIFGFYLFYARRWLWQKKKFVVLALFVLTFLALPILKFSLTPGGQSRTMALSIFSEETSLPWSHGNIDQPKISRTLIVVRKWFALYTAYFSPRNLFSPDPAEKQRWPVDLATFYPWQFIFFIIGVVCFIRKKEYLSLRKTVLPWLIFSPVAASFTRDPFSTVRALPLVFPVSVIIALGIFESLKIRSKKAKVLISSFLLLATVASLANLAIQLFFVLPYQRAGYWEIGYQETVKELLKYPNKKIVIDNTRGESYIHLLFFTKFDPAIYQKEAGFEELPHYYDSFKRIKIKKFGQFEYRSIDWEKEVKEGNLVVGDSLMISVEKILSNPQLELLKEIKYPDNSVAFMVIQALAISTPTK